MSGSVQATDRLMKELRDIYRSPSFKGGKCCRQLRQGLLPCSLGQGFPPRPGWRLTARRAVSSAQLGRGLWPSVGAALSRVSETTPPPLFPGRRAEARSVPWAGGLSGSRGGGARQDVPPASKDVGRRKTAAPGVVIEKCCFSGASVPGPGCAAGPRGLQSWVVAGPLPSLPPPPPG